MSEQKTETLKAIGRAKLKELKGALETDTNQLEYYQRQVEEYKVRIEAMKREMANIKRELNLPF